MIEITAKAGEVTQRPGTEETVYYPIDLPSDLWGTVTPVIEDAWLRLLTDSGYTDKTSDMVGAASAASNLVVSAGVTALEENKAYRVGVKFNVGGNDKFTRYIDIMCLGDGTEL